MEKLIGEIVKTNSVKTKIRITEFKGRTFLDIRDFFKGKGAVDFGPTKKGIAIDISRISDIITLLEKAEAELSTTTSTTS
jgi:hypothetical protein